MQLDEVMTLWTIQRLPVWECLRAQGTYTAPRPEARFATAENVAAYDWMILQMRERGIEVDPHAVPCWAWYAYRFGLNRGTPTIRSSGLLPKGTRAVLLELRVPTVEVVLSQFFMWEEVFAGGYVPLDKTDMERNDNDSLSRERILDSWPRIFDLECGSKELWKRPSRRPIQACLNRLDDDWVRSHQTFIARG